MPRIRSNRRISPKYPNIIWIKRNQKLMARVWIDGRYYHLGCFDAEQEVYAAYEEYLKKVEEIIHV
jgi:hypothetical protein